MIKFTFNYLMPVTLFLSIVVLFQCCAVYDKKQVTIEEAINKEHKEAKYIKIISKRKHYKSECRYESIYYKDNVLYGVITIPARPETIWINGVQFPTGPEEKYVAQINEDEIVRIYLLTSRNH
jgi:hypothetical protein